MMRRLVFLRDPQSELLLLWLRAGICKAIAYNAQFSPGPGGLEDKSIYIPIFDESLQEILRRIVVRGWSGFGPLQGRTCGPSLVYAYTYGWLGILKLGIPRGQNIREIAFLLSALQSQQLQEEILGQSAAPLYPEVAVARLSFLNLVEDFKERQLDSPDSYRGCSSWVSLALPVPRLGGSTFAPPPPLGSLSD